MYIEIKLGYFFSFCLYDLANQQHDCVPFIACFSSLQKAKKIELEITSEPTQKIDLMTIVDNKQSKRVCNEGDPNKDKALTMKFDYKEDFVETQTYTKTHGFTFNGNLKGRSALY